MGKKLLRALAVLMALTLMVPAAAFAQGTTGTIRGKVTDAATGEPLAAVNVVVLESDGTVTNMGNFTNAEGEYVIINVPPGRYTLRASMMGYKITDVTEFLVTVGVSTIQNYALESTVLDVGETIVVLAERELIQRDVAATQQSYTIEEMERMAVSNTTDILNLQTTVYQAYKQTEDIYQYYERGQSVMYMRGGRNAEVAFMVDGMQVTNLLFGGQAMTVSPFSLSEMVIMAGGMSAEFGNAMSGVINMVTREGGTTYDANVELQTSEFTGAGQDDVRDHTSMQGYVGGPVPMVPRLTFFSSGSATTQRSRIQLKDDVVFDLDVTDDPATWDNPNIDYNPADPYDQRSNFGAGRRIHGLDIYSGWLGYGFNDNWDGMLNLTYKLTPSMKVNFSSSLNGRWLYPSGFNNRWSSFFGIPNSIQQNGVFGTPRYDVETDPITGEPVIDGSEDVVPGTGLVDFHNEKELIFEDNYRFAFIWTHQLNQSTFYSVRGSYYDYLRKNRAKRWVNADGWIPRFEHLYQLVDDMGTPGDPSDDRPVWLPTDPMTQVTLLPFPYDEDDQYERTYGHTFHYTGAGLGGDGSALWYQTQDDITRTLKADVTSQVSAHHQVKTGLQYNVLSLDNRVLEAPSYTVPFQNTHWQRDPWELGLYFQDKVEYDFMILNLGMRYDASKAANIRWWNDPRDPFNEDGDLVIYPTNDDSTVGAIAPVATARVRSQFSPRIGVSHPVTDQSVVYFNYGHFFQIPQYDNMFFADNLLGTGPPLIGNPNMESEKTISYEFGYKHQFTEIYALELTLWAKDTSNLVGSEYMPAFSQGNTNPYSYGVFVNYDYASSKGFDINMIRRYSGYFSGRLNYSFMSTQSNRPEPWDGYWNRGILEAQPKRAAVLGWDQPHKFSGTASLSIPEGVGPEVFGVRPFHKTSASIIYRAAAGRPYTPRTRERALERNSGRRPWTFQWDLKLYRDFENFGVRWSLFADVRNLFDRQNVIQVYSRTGKPDDPGPGSTGYSDSYDRFDYYGTPRLINLGLRFYF
jgi:outer membrane receptor protein involved in Fe transport